MTSDPSPTALTNDLINYASSLASTGGSPANPEVLLAFLRQAVGMLGGVEGERVKGVVKQLLMGAVEGDILEDVLDLVAEDVDSMQVNIERITLGTITLF